MLPVGFDPMGIFFEVARDSEADGSRAGKAIRQDFSYRSHGHQTVGTHTLASVATGKLFTAASLTAC